MKKNILILIFFSLSFISRIYISNLSTPKGDILVHQEWSKVLYHQGLTGSYFFNNLYSTHSAIINDDGLFGLQINL